MLLKPIESSAHVVPLFKALCSDNGIVNGRGVSWHRALLAREPVSDGYLFFRVYLTIKWNGNFFTIPIDCFLFWLWCS